MLQILEKMKAVQEKIRKDVAGLIELKIEKRKDTKENPRRTSTLRISKKKDQEPNIKNLKRCTQLRHRDGPMKKMTSQVRRAQLLVTTSVTKLVNYLVAITVSMTVAMQLVVPHRWKQKETPRINTDQQYPVRK